MNKILASMCTMKMIEPTKFCWYLRITLFFYILILGQLIPFISYTIRYQYIYYLAIITNISTFTINQVTTQ